MAEEPIRPNPPVDTGALLAEVEALRKSKAEILDDLKKAKNSRFTFTQLKAVYRRGQGAYLGSGSRNTSMAAWAMGRVNSFITGKGGARTADADIMRKK